MIISQSTIGWNPQWEEFFSNSWGNRYPDPMVVRFVARHFYSLAVQERKETKILDIGCGTGPHSWFLAREGFSVFGVDGSVSAIEKARERLAEEALPAQFDVSDLTALPYFDSSMDAVIDAMALQHNPDARLKEIIHEVHRVLRPSGRFFSMHIAEERISSSIYTNYKSDAELEAFYGPLFKDVQIGRIEYGWESLATDFKFWIVQASWPV